VSEATNLCVGSPVQNSPSYSATVLDILEDESGKRVRDIRHHTILTSDLPQGSTWVRYGLRMTTEPGCPIGDALLWNAVDIEFRSGRGRVPPSAQQFARYQPVLPRGIPGHETASNF
jgi:hypothetical protein